MSLSRQCRRDLLNGVRHLKSYATSLSKARSSPTAPAWLLTEVVAANELVATLLYRLSRESAVPGTERAA